MSISKMSRRMFARRASRMSSTGSKDGLSNIRTVDGYGM